MQARTGGSPWSTEKSSVVRDCNELNSSREVSSGSSSPTAGVRHQALLNAGKCFSWLPYPEDAHFPSLLRSTAIDNPFTTSSKRICRSLGGNFLQTRSAAEKRLSWCAFRRTSFSTASGALEAPKTLKSNLSLFIEKKLMLGPASIMVYPLMWDFLVGQCLNSSNPR